MKSMINRVNQYLIERYPNIWNTRLVWMLLAALVIHLLFYLAGFLTFSDVRTLHERQYDNNVIEKNGVVLFSSIVSVLLIVVWLVYLLKNNAFKNFYSTSGKKIFLGFLYSFIIFSVSISFLLSYTAGYKTYINARYPVEKIKEQVRLSNKAEPFLLNSPESYTPDNKRYPAPFDRLYCATGSVDTDKPFIKMRGKMYQFYTKKTVAVSDTDMVRQEQYRSDYIDEYQVGDSLYFVLKDTVMDVSSLLDTVLTIYNYSGHTFSGDDGYYDYRSSGLYEGEAFRSPDLKTIRNKEVYELLQRNNREEIRKILSDFLDIADAYKIPHNLETERWMALVYHPAQFRVDSFIRNYDPRHSLSEPVEYYEPEAAVAAVAATEAVDTYMQHEERVRTTRLFFLSGELENLYTNIYDLGDWSPMEMELSIALWFAFFFAVILFIFRSSGLKSLIFSGIAAGVLALIIALITLLLRLDRGGDGLRVMYLVFFVACMILLLPLILRRSLNKMIRSIFMNITITMFVPFLLLILIIINTHQEHYFEMKYGVQYSRQLHEGIMDKLGNTWTWILLAAGLLFMWLYAARVKRWKALPED